MEPNPAVMKQKCQQEIANSSTNSPVDRFRYKLFLHSGEAGIKGIGRMFKILDDDGNRKLSKEEFKKGITERRVNLTPAELEALFAEIDKDNTGSIEYEEFLKALRGPMNSCRLKLVEQAFNKLDKTGDGIVMGDDLEGVYNYQHHPKFVSGEWTGKQCKRAFLDSFDIKDHGDGMVTKEEFINYYHGVSISIDQDPYFDLMMRRAWGL
ncbi:calcyphosin-like protein [Haliotis rubra]|uniref:calcyphosin-like protein n=1 Tax=Haliotis rubra TaxID=36100 RepID=UPI001EE614BB|nr:calcyphosin-like protein [Haliotis rubra]XP_046554300.1 calcyphosin-like protein [Haliotis rubra]XP_046554301.1 calcyphosin-like protein [Haliotis rubra]